MYSIDVLTCACTERGDVGSLGADSEEAEGRDDRPVMHKDVTGSVADAILAVHGGCCGKKRKWHGSLLMSFMR